jgi:hypothetical protein
MCAKAIRARRSHPLSIAARLQARLCPCRPHVTCLCMAMPVYEEPLAVHRNTCALFPFSQLLVFPTARQEVITRAAEVTTKIAEVVEIGKQYREQLEVCAFCWGRFVNCCL